MNIAFLLFFLQSLYAHDTTFELKGWMSSAVAWSPDSSEIAIGTDEGIFFIDPSNGEIIDKIGFEAFHDERPPHTIMDIDWSPDGKNLAISATEMITVHYPVDVWIVSRKERTTKKVTNSILSSPVREDNETATYNSTYYGDPKWSPDGQILLLTVETIEKTYSKTNDDVVDANIMNVIATLDPKTEELKEELPGTYPRWSKDGKKLFFAAGYDNPYPQWTIDYDESSQTLITGTKAPLTNEQTQDVIGLSKKLPEFPWNDQFLSPDETKIIIRISGNDQSFLFYLKHLPQKYYFQMS